MSTIAIIVHANDHFHHGDYMLQGLIPYFIEAGHFVIVQQGISTIVPADIGILHVDLTDIPADYIKALASYPTVINGGTTTLQKRAFSQHILQPDEPYDGLVIVKTNANSGARPELKHAQIAHEQGASAGPPLRYFPGRYTVYPSVEQVPRDMRDDPTLVVEKFLPEQDQSGNYYLRVWSFFGDSERCTRYRARVPVIKASDTLDSEPCPVPDLLRDWRQRLGFDYGKFDFVIHNSQPILLDVNRTPTAPAVVSEVVEAGMANLAKGIDTFV